MNDSITIKIAYMLLSIFIFVACIAFSKWCELSRNRKLRDLVSWCVVKEKYGELLVHAHDLPLWAYIKNAQIKSLAKEYHISGDEEWAFVKEILEEYQRDLIQSYFKGHLSLMKSKYEIDGEVYFMFSLYAFLSEHQCEYEFLGHDMHKERLEYKHYGDWGGPLFDAKYEQTDFAVVLHKMHYVTYMYCRESEILKNFVPEWNEKILKEILDTKQIQISRV